MSKLFTKSQRSQLIELFGFPQRLTEKRLKNLLTDGGFSTKKQFQSFWINQLQTRLEEEKATLRLQQERDRKKMKKYLKEAKLSNKKEKIARDIRKRAEKALDKDFIYSVKGTGEVNAAWAIFTSKTNELMHSNTDFNVVVLEYDPFDLEQENKIDTILIGSTRKALKRKQYKEMKQRFGTTLYAIHNKNADEVLEHNLDTGDEVDTVNIKIAFIASVKPMGYIHALKESEVFNCFLTQMKAWAVMNDDRSTFEKVNILNKKYFDSGVKFSDIPDICNKVHCNVEIYNKLDDKLFEHKYSTGKYKTFKYVITKNDHVEAYIEDMFNVSEKPIQYVEDVDEAFANCGSAWKCYTKTQDGKLVYFFTADKVYKRIETQSFDEGKYFINSEFDLENIQFTQDYQLDRNVMIKNRDEALFDFVIKSNHYIYETYFTENIDEKHITKSEPEWDDLEGCYLEEEGEETTVDMSTYFAYDQNKNYMSYKKNKYYHQYQFPKTGNFNFYHVHESFTDYDRIIAKCGFVQIQNINYDLCEENTRRIIKRLNYFQEGGIYATPLIKCIHDQGVRFTISAVAFTNWTYNIDFSEEIMTNKFYNKIVGMMDIKTDHRIIKTVYKDINELQDLLFASADKITFYNDNELWFKLPKSCVKNNSHISSFILSYAFIGVLEQLLKVQFDDIIGVKVDCIITKKNYDHVFKLSKEVGEWKRENKGQKVIYDCGFINDIEPFTNTPLTKLTLHKLNYKHINFITGEAGAGKTTRYVATFGETDERVYNFLMCFPNNNLKGEFNKKYDCRTSTYHKAFRVGSNGEDNDGIKIKYYANAIIDEASMISLDHFEQILKEAEKFCVDLHIVGDYDVDTKKLYQLTPPEGQPFVEWFNRSYDDYYHIHLTENYRQGDDKAYTEFLRSCRGLTNKQILEKLRADQSFTRISINDISKFYNDGDVVLCSVNDYVNKINDILKIRENLQVKYKKTTRTHAKNEMAFVKSNEYDAVSMDLAFSITNHLCQGLEYKEKVFIVLDRLFEDNMLYVCLSRAKSSEQIYLVNVGQGSKVCSVDTNIMKKLNKYKWDDKKKGFEGFDLDKAYILGMLKAQGCKCKHCNCEVLTENYAPFSLRQFSVDRIDNNKGHIKGNVVIACFGCNSRHENENC